MGLAQEEAAPTKVSTLPCPNLGEWVSPQEAAAGVLADYAELISVFNEVVAAVEPGPEIIALKGYQKRAQITTCERMCCQALRRPSQKHAPRRCMSQTVELSTATQENWKALVLPELVDLITKSIDYFST